MTPIPPSNNASIEYEEEHYYKYSNDNNNNSSGYEIFNTAHLSLPERLVACLGNECMTDVCLVGEHDGIPVPACRFLLGAASPVFQPLLYGNLSSSEGNASTVTIQDSNQKSLQALVEFCASDELNTTLWADSAPVEILQDSVMLSKLAVTYEMPKLQRKVDAFLKPLLNRYPPLSCLVLNSSDQQAAPDIYQMALTLIRENAYAALDSTLCIDKQNNMKGGLASLTPENLERVLSDNNVQADELFLFHQLLAWKLYNQQKYANAKKICQHVVRHIDLESMDPEELEGTVMPSGFVDDSVLVQVLMKQARTARMTRDDSVLTFSSLRGKRGKKYVNILVENAGDHECNGVYVYFDTKQEGDQGDSLLYFVKKARENTASDSGEKNKAFVLVKDSIDTWRICDNYKNIVYERLKISEDSPSDEFPSKGWARVTGVDPAPTCKPSKGYPEHYSKQSLNGAGLDKEKSAETAEVMSKSPTQKMTATLKTTTTKSSSRYNHESSSAAVKTDTSETGTATLTSSNKSESSKIPSPKLKKPLCNVKSEAKDKKKKATRKLSLMDDEEEPSELVDKVTEADTHSIQESTGRNDPLLGKEVGGTGFNPEKEDLNELIKRGVAAKIEATKGMMAAPTANVQCGMIPQDESIFPGCSSYMN